MIAGGAAWFTDSFIPVLYKLPIHRDGSLPAPNELVKIPLTGDLQYVDGFNASGIAPSPDGSGLLIAQINMGKLFRVDLPSGTTHQIDLGAQTLTNPDGMLLDGHRLFVAENRQNEVAALNLNDDGTAAKVDRRVTDRRFDIPTRIARNASLLYLPNARTTTPPEPTTPYTAVAIPEP